MSYCCICKSHSGSHADITFHTIPRSEDLRAKWIAVIGKNVSNYSKVCSDHFKPSFFQYKINKLNNIQRHLIKGAIPTAEKCQGLHDTRELKLVNVKSESCESELVNILNNENSAVQHPREIKDVLSPVPLYNADNSQNDSMSTSQNDSMSTRKRKLSTDVATTCNKVRTVKFIGDLCPEDFTSPECYNVVKKYLKTHKTRVNSLQKQVSRLSKKVKNLEDLLSVTR
ncbi:PREDICTED: THAP domain-containing protein 1-like isoform X5 [Vollenhovia emeryi]|uniref:THAP domain-containing protein 1-like isoform X5 n=1 Tax=Vollenhovia emeryi TaxID=411798 RepID=UPI0005F43CD0|nr:PREDICTED: THAP domain-containing protein 1-like isoform X5 [Vollenhovia emeryi]